MSTYGQREHQFLKKEKKMKLFLITTALWTKKVSVNGESAHLMNGSLLINSSSLNC
jgi:hypothetical protein